jgi:16S rRNA processing protein RimM
VSSSTSSTDWLVAGRVGRPHGLDGSFHVHEPRADLLTRGAIVNGAGDEREIVRRAGTDARPIVAVAGCADRTAAEALRGAELLVARAAAPALGEDEFYAEELEGCRVHDAGVEVGVVRRLLALPSCEVLEIARAAGGADLLVPMIRDAIREVDLEKQRIDVDMAFLGER